ncbi:MAG: YihA family ribosome biogenesis GTP-binding protein [Alphaproteobacteria bacterium]|nr:YihA family ribosome biogenesis GTP-binding protein [Alphaproteobacteria bacterium]
MAARTRSVFAQECRVDAVVRPGGAWPPERTAEVAFAGRSNVGKSSLINALVGRDDLARTSRTPGTTRTIAFYRIGHDLTLVDLPGYGFAAAGRAAMVSWQGLVAGYFESRRALRRVCLLVDGYVGLKSTDLTALESLAALAVETRIVLTKVDRNKDPAAMQRSVQAATAGFANVLPAILMTSVRRDVGLAELRDDLASLATGARDAL